MTFRPPDNFVPPWQDLATLCAHICATPHTVNAWVVQGTLPPPRMRGGKQMWKWSEVDEYLTRGREAVAPDADAQRIRENVKRAQAEDRAGY
jgi:hypothetical protein